jgi:hypothetical protein
MIIQQVVHKKTHSLTEELNFKNHRNLRENTWSSFVLIRLHIFHHFSNKVSKKGLNVKSINI